MRTVLSKKGQVVLPAAIRDQDQLEPGTEFEIKHFGPGEYRLLRVSAVNAGLVDRLLACPEKDYFVPIRSESTERRRDGLSGGMGSEG